MLFLVHWELNENIALEERLRTTRRLTATGLFPAKGVQVLRWDVTPDAWGIALLAANSAADVIVAVETWRAALPGFFRSTRTAPVVPVEDMLPLQEALVQSVGGKSG